MAISERSARIHDLYRQWLRLDGLLAAAAEAQAPLDAAASAQRDQAWTALHGAIHGLVTLSLGTLDAAAKQAVVSTLCCGERGEWVLDLCEQIQPKKTIRHIVEAEISALKQVAAEPPAQPDDDGYATTLLAHWLAYDNAWTASGHEDRALRDRLLEALQPVVLQAARWLCRGDTALAGDLAGEINRDWADRGVLHGFDPNMGRIVGWAWGAARLKYRHLQTAQRRRTARELPICTSPDGDADLVDAMAGSRLQSTIARGQMPEILRQVLDDLQHAVTGGQRMALVLDNGEELAGWKPRQTHVLVLQAAMADRFDPTPGVEKHAELAVVTGLQRSTGAKVLREALAYVAQHPLAAALKSLLQPSVPRQFNKPEHGGGDQIKVIARLADGSG